MLNPSYVAPCSKKVPSLHHFGAKHKCIRHKHDLISMLILNMNCRLHKSIFGGKNCDKSESSIGKHKLRAFSQKNFARLQLKYPFLPKSQLRWKVKTLWGKLNAKNCAEFHDQTTKKKTSNVQAGVLSFSSIPSTFFLSFTLVLQH